MGYFLFILLNAAVYIRPAELAPELEYPIYSYVMYACLAMSGPRILARMPSLTATPMGALVLLLPVAAILSHLTRGYLGGVIQAADLCLRLIVYYLVFVTVVDSPGRLRSFLGWLVGFTLAITTLAVLHYNGVVNIPSLQAYQQRDIDPATGELYTIPRLCSTGIFNDPNDLSMILVLGIIVGLYLLETGRSGARYLWTAPIGCFVYALKLTFSRGGILNLVVSLLILSLAKLGRKKTFIVCVCALPCLLALFGGRQTRIDLNNKSDTSQGRIQIWVEGLIVFREAPLFGIGVGEFPKRLVHVAHNTYVQTYVEEGFFGGTVFSGAFYTAIWGIRRLLRHHGTIFDRDVERLGPYILALICSFGFGMFSLSRAEAVPTYMILGIGTVYLQIASMNSSMARVELDSRYVTRLCTFSVLWLTFLHIFSNLMVRW
jgi:putative inorganic carbon (hco3(-)) transporter